MKLHRLVLPAIAVLVAAITAAQAQDQPGVTNDAIRIGLVAPLSGPLVGFGYDPLYASKMWFDKVNADGGIYGRKIELIIDDSKCEIPVMLALVKRLVSVDKVFLIEGGSCSPVAQAAQEYVTREKVPMITLNAGADAGAFPPTRYFFAGPVGTQLSSGGAVMQFAIKSLGAKSVAILVHDDDSGTANLAAAKATAEKARIAVKSVERVSKKAVDLTAAMLNVRAANPDAIVAILYPAQTALSVQKYGEFAMKQPVITGVQSVTNPAEFAENVGNDAALANFYFGTPLAPDAEIAKWTELYRAAYPDRKPGPWVAFGIPSAMAITIALKKAGPELTREKFIDAMDTLEFESGALAGPSRYAPDRRDGFRSMAFVKFDGKKLTRQEGVFTWAGER